MDKLIILLQHQLLEAYLVDWEQGRLLRRKTVSQVLQRIKQQKMLELHLLDRLVLELKTKLILLEDCLQALHNRHLEVYLVQVHQLLKKKNKIKLKLINLHLEAEPLLLELTLQRLLELDYLVQEQQILQHQIPLLLLEVVPLLQQELHYLEERKQLEPLQLQHLELLVLNQLINKKLNKLQHQEQPLSYPEVLQCH